MRTVLSILFVVSIVMALPLGVLAWQNNGSTVGCPAVFYGQMNGIYYYYVQACDGMNCPYVPASSTRLHQLTGSCNCPNGTETCDELGLTYGVPPDGTFTQSAPDLHWFEGDKKIAFAKKKPGQGDKPGATAETDPAFFYPGSFSINAPYERDRIAHINENQNDYYFRILELSDAFGDRPMFIGQEIQEPESEDVVVEATDLERIGDYCYKLVVEGSPYYVRTRHVIINEP